MADDKKKSKIDLKARLGKTSMTGSAPGVPIPVPGPPGPPGSAPPPADSNPSSPGAARPTPVASGSVRPPPIGIAPPAGISPGIPLPPFGHRPAPQAAPKPTAAQQTIKVEVGEEIHAERAAATKRAAIYAAIAAVVALAIGFVAGGSSEKGGNLKAAAKGAATLEKDVREADSKMKELEEQLKAAYEKMYPQGDAATKMATRQFPDIDLGKIHIPFDAGNLDNKPGENKQVGNLPGKVLRALLAYTSAVDDVNKTKDLLKNALTGAKDPTLKAWKEEKDPMANYAVAFSGNTNKVAADLVPIKEPFAWKADFPAGFTITKLENGKGVEKKAVRWVKGDLTGGTDLVAIPIDPKSMGGLTTDARVAAPGKLLAELLKDLDGGVNPDDPANESVGLIKQGEDLANQLHTASLNQ